MSEEKKCPKCGEKMIYYPGRRSFGKTGKYICNCKDSEGEKVPASGEKCRTCEAWNPEEFASECEDMYNGIRPLRCEKLPEPSENDDKKIKIWCYECHDDYFIFDSWNGSECPHCGCWNKKDSEGENETEPLYQPRRIGEKLKYLEKEKPPEIQDCTECDEPHKYDETGTLYCTSNQCKEAEPEKECQKKVKITDEFQFENEEGRIILYNDGSLWLQRKDTPKTFWYYLKGSGGENKVATTNHRKRETPLTDESTDSKPPELLLPTSLQDRIVDKYKSCQWIKDKKAKLYPSSYPIPKKESKPPEQDGLNDQWNDGERPPEPKDEGCVLIRNAQNDPDWDGSLNAELCKGDCQSCPHYEPSENDILKEFVSIRKKDLLHMIIDLRCNVYGFETETWFTNIEETIGYNYKKDLKLILEEREEIKKMGEM